MSYAPDDNPEIEYAVYLKRLPPVQSQEVMIFCHANECVNSAEWAIVTQIATIRLCLVHLDMITETLVSLREIRENKEDDGPH